jgi:D-sedoheptulose 7-phosphate isomerase
MTQMSNVKSYTESTPTDAAALLAQELQEHREAFESTAQMLSHPFAETLELLERSVRHGGKLLLFGNGGSAADAQHIAAELVIRYKADRSPIAAIALTTDSSALTACGNDLGFDAIFERQVEAVGRANDVAVGISTSGNSPNVLKGLRQARAMGLKTVGLTGAGGGQMPSLCDALIVVPSSVTARIQEMHITIGHVLCKALEQRLGLV